MEIFEAWLPPRQSHLLPWAAKFQHLKVHCQIIPTNCAHAELIAFYKMVFLSLVHFFIFKSNWFVRVTNPCHIIYQVTFRTKLD